jgi:hypothetical protein
MSNGSNGITVLHIREPTRHLPSEHLSSLPSEHLSSHSQVKRQAKRHCPSVKQRAVGKEWCLLDRLDMLIFAANSTLEAARQRRLISS